MMSKTDEMTGTFVLVNPDLAHDPAGRQNQVGLVTEADLDSDDIYVSFGKNGQSRYSSDALLVLKSNISVYNEMMDNRMKLSSGDFKTLFRVNLLQQTDRPAPNREALLILKDHPNLQQFALIPLNDKLGINHVATVHLNQLRPPARAR
ncbi:hypothetical protein PQ469_12150 [Mucilaginibacter sp. KACC 22773]|uniref:hypothetical protein n=1 Tax=Mucilaginibacter sp. KACC 22773 TaxID=3025671 RepID=UPI00236684D4|nr:hypothetical protein [Mucilaginibacter sp. KACC 22773]WDF80759.1 hypothetical protein PQ469_12150 [Mucilaginibacter sp. KACC 22773]